MDSNDCVSVDRLIKSKLKDDVIHYQPLSHSEKQALIIVFSTPWQGDQLKKYRSDMIYLDATYKGITQYGFAFYAVIIKSPQGRGVPVAFFILSEESTERELQECASPFQPRFFFSMKYQFLQGYANRRIDELLHLLSKKVVTYYSYLEELYKDGRIKSKKPDVAELLSRTKSKGLHDKVVFQSAGQISVTSETTEGKCYKIVIKRLLFKEESEIVS
ncbi:uncharacterized protein LOC108411626 [Pygocentrus nattereri]|uniref:uncharacterized protein LOC108411626 n=1 Tax=Pygocentrus nattereri TaxID=42514 RepID=UPI00081496B2|nr:uncharacterized protein LOC108411626 [Pygocentrus nattereri]